MNEKIKKAILNFTFVFFQFGGILYLLFTGPIFAPELVLLILEMIGIILAFWAALVMKLDNINIVPELKNEVRLVKSGPYSLIRHPMYLATVIVFTALLISAFSYFRLIAYLVIWIDLLLKLHYEEKLLKQAFEEYSDYQKKTFRIIPFVY